MINCRVPTWVDNRGHYVLRMCAPRSVTTNHRPRLSWSTDIRVSYSPVQWSAVATQRTVRWSLINGYFIDFRLYVTSVKCFRNSKLLSRLERVSLKYVENLQLFDVASLSRRAVYKLTWVVTNSRVIHTRSTQKFNTKLRLGDFLQNLDWLGWQYFASGGFVIIGVLVFYNRKTYCQKYTVLVTCLETKCHH